MCFLRPARGLGWLDPRLNRSTTTSSRSHHHARSNTTQTGAVAVGLDAGECEKSLGVVGLNDEALWKTILCIYINYLHSMVA